MNSAKIFEFVGYKMRGRTLTFHYRTRFKDGSDLKFTERLILPKLPDMKRVPPDLLANMLENLHLMLGVSYYKSHLAHSFALPYKLTREQTDFWNTVYLKGLGELLYRNHLPLTAVARFKPSAKVPASPHRVEPPDRSLIGIGGGKDSIVAIELLKEIKRPLTGFVLETHERQEITNDVAKVSGLGALKVVRQIDKKLRRPELNRYRGHIPISAIYAWVGLLCGVLYGYSEIIVANEVSSDMGNLRYRGLAINHQWSKSSEFEQLFAEYISRHVVNGIRYFSLLRPFYEIRVAELLARYPQYFQHFSSCNRILIHPKLNRRWCGECPKCAYVFLLLAAYLPKRTVVGIFGRDLLDDRLLLSTYRDLLGLGKLKPFDCVGTFEESVAALQLAKKRFAASVVVKTLGGRLVNPQPALRTVTALQTAANLPARYKLLGIKNVLLVGYGKEGKQTELYLRSTHPRLKVGIADAKQGRDYLDKQSGYEFAVKTPGIPKRLVTIPYTTATNLFMSANAERTIGITGTKGKSTTASLIHAIFKAAGIKTRLLGNIGTPMLTALSGRRDRQTLYIVELSSYQLDDADYSPHIAVALNLFPEHMNYHRGTENYYAAKQTITSRQTASDVFIYNTAFPLLKSWARQSRAQTIPFVSRIPAGIKSPLLGSHNRDNLRAAITVAREFGISDSAIKRALKEFKPLPHRLEYIGSFRGIRFYDDAISTTPESTIMAIRALPKIGTIFLGGEDRGYDFHQLEREIRANAIKNIVLFPDSGGHIFRSTHGLNVLRTRSMAAAVKFAYKNTRPGKICLLSTASPSYSLWTNFEAKGSEFKKAIREQARSKS